jgi:UDP-N-acetylmuramate dehydrogenase
MDAIYIDAMYIEDHSLMLIQEQVALAPLTTFGVGGPARYFAEATSFTEARSALDFAQSRGLPWFVLGGGSNLLVSDAGFPGLVLHISVRGIERREEDGKMVFEAGAGEPWDAFVAEVVSANCAGIECLSGIPGTVGGTPVQNVGAYGQEVSETITEVLVLDTVDGQLHTLCAPACDFSYRSSIFNSTARGRYIVLRVTYAFEPGGEARVEYRDIRNFFAGKNQKPSLSEVRDAVRQIRQSKGMLIVAGDDDCRSAGSFFKNPVLSPESYQSLKDRAAARGLEIPAYPAPGQTHKIPAAWLVEQAGFPKGYNKGPVGISRKHSLAIVNRGGARAADVVALKNEIQARVEDQFGIRLVPEPVMIGFDRDVAADAALSQSGAQKGLQKKEAAR